MPHDPARVAECRGWLDRAWADLESAAIPMGAARPRPDTALFHCQQAVEKAWKAFLFWHDVPFRKTHNLRELGEACVALDSSLRPLAERAEDLTPFAWLFRYPGKPEEPPREEAEAALALARGLRGGARPAAGRGPAVSRMLVQGDMRREALVAGP